MKKPTIIIISICGLIISFMIMYYYISPYAAIFNIKKAADNKDYIYLREHIDFPAIKQTLKEQVDILYRNHALKDPDMKDNPFAGLATIFTGSLIDAYVSPAAISEILGSNNDNVDWMGIILDHKIGYSDLDTFVIIIEGQEEEWDMFFIMKRECLYTWVVKDVVLK